MSLAGAASGPRPRQTSGTLADPQHGLATRLLVFAKEPVPGQVKTRLAAAVGPSEAASIYRELTAATLAHARRALVAGSIDAIELWCTPTPASAYFQSLAEGSGATLHQQADCADLGERMAIAIASALARAPAVLLIGTDCPAIDPTRLARASNALLAHDVVLQPAEDGGFVLVGTRRPLTFGLARWSTPHACADVAAAFVQAGIQSAMLPVLWDVDEPADLARWNAMRAAMTSALA
jgi:uncharacterized protein